MALHPAKWLNILLMFIGLHYAWMFYENIRDLLLLLSCTDCEFDITQVYLAFYLLYIPFIFYLLVKRNRWGWILLFADVIFTLTLKMFQLFVFFSDGMLGIDAPGIIFMIICIKMLCIIFLWRPVITKQYNVNTVTQKLTRLFAGLAALAYAVIQLLPVYETI